MGIYFYTFLKSHKSAAKRWNKLETVYGKEYGRGNESHKIQEAEEQIDEE